MLILKALTLACSVVPQTNSATASPARTNIAMLILKALTRKLNFLLKACSSTLWRH